VFTVGRGDAVRRSDVVPRTEEYFAARARRADPAKIARILKRVGKGNPPVEGDELPPEFAAKNAAKKKRRR
jgi:hypothetical protein